jgi:hypothetical protein
MPREVPVGTQSMLSTLQKELDMLEQEARVDDALGRVVIIASAKSGAGPKSFRGRSRRLAANAAAARDECTESEASPTASVKQASLTASSPHGSPRDSPKRADSQLNDALDLLRRNRRERELAAMREGPAVPDVIRAVLSGSPKNATLRREQSAASLRRIGSHASQGHASVTHGSGLYGASQYNGSLTTGQLIRSHTHAGADMRLGYLADADTVVARQIALVMNRPRYLHELSTAHRELYDLLTADLGVEDETEGEGPTVIQHLQSVIKRHAERRVHEQHAQEMAASQRAESQSLVERRRQQRLEAERRRVEDEDAARRYDEGFARMRLDLRAEVMHDVFGEPPAPTPAQRVVSRDQPDLSRLDCLAGPNASLASILNDVGGRGLHDQALDFHRRLTAAREADEADRQEAVLQAAVVSRTAARVRALREPAERRAAEERRLALEAVNGPEEEGSASHPPDDSAASPLIVPLRRASPARRPRKDASIAAAQRELAQLLDVQDEADSIRARREAHMESAQAQRRALLAGASFEQPYLVQSLSVSEGPATTASFQGRWRCPRLPSAEAPQRTRDNKRCRCLPRSSADPAVASRGRAAGVAAAARSRRRWRASTAALHQRVAAAAA